MRFASLALAALATGCAGGSNPYLPARPPEDLRASLVRVAPAAGLSAIERAPATPGRIRLEPNPALVDGDTAAPAGVDLGAAAAASRDRGLRDVGVELPEGAPADLLRIWVDRPVPAELRAELQWGVLSSADGERWSPVAAREPVRWDGFENRFDLAIERTTARYLKAVAHPLPAAVAKDPAVAELQVTEIGVYRADRW
ncbi:MAG TPA: hypothetical protein VML50_11350 [Anaeromyxobacter sp.]|nr:hypothetical protein [Anaeromyxobacter sp.]